MKIAVIGAGNAGSAIARAARRGGHDVVITSASSATAQQVAHSLGVAAATSNEIAAATAEAVVLAVPFGAVAEVAAGIREVAAGKIVIDATNPLRPDYSGLAVSDRSGAEQLAGLLPRSAVVKAFNTVLAANQAEPVTGGVALDGFYAGDDDTAKAAVAGLLAGLGYRPVDCGGLSAALALEQLAFLNISLNARNNWPWRSGWKLVGPAG